MDAVIKNCTAPCVGRITRDDYLKQQAAAQFAVAEDKLVEAVREVLARHGVNWS